MAVVTNSTDSTLRINGVATPIPAGTTIYIPDALGYAIRGIEGLVVVLDTAPEDVVSDSETDSEAKPPVAPVEETKATEPITERKEEVKGSEVVEQSAEPTDVEKR